MRFDSTQPGIDDKGTLVISDTLQEIREIVSKYRLDYFRIDPGTIERLVTPVYGR